MQSQIETLKTILLSQKVKDLVKSTSKCEEGSPHPISPMFREVHGLGEGEVEDVLQMVRWMEADTWQIIKIGVTDYLNNLIFNNLLLNKLISNAALIQQLSGMFTGKDISPQVLEELLDNNPAIQQILVILSQYLGAQAVAGGNVRV
mmetsp:Transcript_6000/g.10192  ORF Transcript_6000/g.10192 Transcript_6000/m.10192 type:complete len:147 (-) Transcript_6000:23-463(-)